MIDFEKFRTILESKLQTTELKSNAGRRPIDPVLMFKVMFVQWLYGLSDEQAEYQIKDRTVFVSLSVFVLSMMSPMLVRYGSIEKNWHDAEHMMSYSSNSMHTCKALVWLSMKER